MTEQETAYYLYCLAPCGPSLALNEAGVMVRDWDGIRVILSQARREDFCGEGAEARLQNLAWLAPRACRHEAVVEQVMGQSPVLPARFATLFTSLDSLHRWVIENHDAIAGFFTHLGSQREWSVKGLLDRALAERRGEAGRPAKDASPGKQYLQRKRAEPATVERMSQWLRAACENAVCELEPHASAFRERKVWKESDSSGAAEVILNWAYLLAAGAEADFRRRVQELDDRYSANGLSFRLSGPWPPYSFAPTLRSETSS